MQNYNVKLRIYILKDEENVKVEDFRYKLEGFMI